MAGKVAPTNMGEILSPTTEDTKRIMDLVFGPGAASVPNGETVNVSNGETASSPSGETSDVPTDETTDVPKGENPADPCPVQMTPKVPKESQKSVFWAYFWWLFGGAFGLHHVYLHRDFHAFVHWSTFGGYFGVGWCIDLFKVPAFVRDFNEDPVFIKQFVAKLQTNRRPPFSTYRFMAAISTGFLWGQIAQIAVPNTSYGNFDFSYLHWFIPLAIALGKFI